MPHQYKIILKYMAKLHTSPTLNMCSRVIFSYFVSLAVHGDRVILGLIVNCVINCYYHVYA